MQDRFLAKLGEFVSLHLAYLKPAWVRFQVVASTFCLQSSGLSMQRPYELTTVDLS